MFFGLKMLHVCADNCITRIEQNFTYGRTKYFRRIFKDKDILLCLLVHLLLGFSTKSLLEKQQRETAKSQRKTGRQRATSI